MVKRRASRGDDAGEALANRAKRSAKNKDKTGLGSGKILDILDTSEYPDLVQYKPTAGKGKKNKLDFLPFVITQDWYPTLKEKSGATVGLKPGQQDYKLEIPVHQRIGPANKVYICLRLAFGKKCPICDDLFVEYAKAKEDRDEKVIKALRYSWRVFYNVLDHNGEDEEIKIMEISYAMFEDMLLEAIAEDEDSVSTFTHLKKGKTVIWKGKEKSLGDNAFVECVDIDFEEREPFNSAILEDVYPLDKMLIIAEYDEIYEAHRFGEGASNEENDDDNEGEENSKEEGKMRCPEGYDFGGDCNEYDECKECDEDLFFKCANKQEQDEKGNKKSNKKSNKKGKGKGKWR